MADDAGDGTASQTKKQERKSRGLARIWNDADIARMTRITKLDVANAARWWRKHAPARYRKLLNAKSKKEPTENNT